MSWRWRSGGARGPTDGGGPYQYPNTEEDFVDEEEEEEEENAKQTSGECVLPGSQDLFLSLEPIHSQGLLFPDPEGREGTSACLCFMAAGPDFCSDLRPYVSGSCYHSH
ncbi:hypothetical protein UY3_02960 [Chelonia mydas]|uniref:Uncharacterized protein n=1 Tax=Chelonia mydas TaxID=8469 RepID=M7BPJ0_CHEMY|nr:hypothetical protein UY3_02960 [Chelonia mydas]